MYAFSAINIIPEKPSFTEYEKLYLSYSNPQALTQIEANIETVDNAKVIENEPEEVVEKPCASKTDHQIKRLTRKSKQINTQAAPESAIEPKKDQLTIATNCIKDNLASPEQRKVVIGLEEEETKKVNVYKAQVPTIISKRSNHSQTKGGTYNNHSDLITDLPAKEMEIMTGILIPAKSKNTTDEQPVLHNPLEDNAEDFERLVLGISENEQKKPTNKVICPRKRFKRRMGKLEDNKDSNNKEQTIPKTSEEAAKSEKTEIKGNKEEVNKKQDVFEEVW